MIFRADSLDNRNKNIAACIFPALFEKTTIMAVWNIQSVNKLIDIWADERVQDMLESSYRNKDVFSEIADKMNENVEEEGRFTWLQCRNKIKTLRSEYRKAKQYQEKSGSGRTRFIYFDKMDAVLGDRPSVTPLHSIDTSLEDNTNVSSDEEDPTRTSTPASVETEGTAEAELDDPAEETGITEKADLPNITHTPRVKTSENTKQSAVNNKNKITSAKEGNDNIVELTGGKSTNGSQSESSDATNSAKKSESSDATKSTKKSSATKSFQIRKRKSAQSNQGVTETLETFMKMEEKSTKEQRDMEERMAKHQMEFEVKMRKLEMEREDNRRKEERNFQMQLMGMQMQMFGAMTNPGFNPNIQRNYQHMSPGNNIFNNPSHGNNTFNNPTLGNNSFNNPTHGNNAFNNPTHGNNTFNNPTHETNTFNNPGCSPSYPYEPIPPEENCDNEVACSFTNLMNL